MSLMPIGVGFGDYESGNEEDHGGGQGCQAVEADKGSRKSLETPRPEDERDGT
jgi:hypothetical protein